MSKENDRIELLEKRIKDLEVQLKALKNRSDFFVLPLALAALNESSRPHIVTGIPPIMAWLSNEFRGERDVERKKYLRNLYYQFKETLPVDLLSLKDLPEVIDKEPDWGIFDR